MKMIKAFLVAAVAVVAAFVQAATEIVDGIKWTYTVTDGKASVGGGSSSSPAVPKSTSGTITIPSTLGGYPVTSIGSSALRGCSSLTSVTIPDSVTSIGDNAFEGCSEVENMIIPNSVIRIGARAFKNCTSLESVILSDKLAMISHELFRGCISLTNCVIPHGISEIGSHAFDGCISLQEIVIPKNVKVVSGRAFMNCSKLRKLSFESGLQSIDYEAFQNCIGLTDVVLPNTVTNLCVAAFRSCSNLVSVALSSNLERIEGGAFQYCVSLKEMAIPSSVKFIGGTTFSRCRSLEKIVLPRNLDYIGSQTFLMCSSLKEINIPDSVRFIGEGAFNGCRLITSLKLPSKLEYIGDDAFSYMVKLDSLVIPDGVRYIGSWAFSDCENLNSVKLGNKIREIGEGAFGGCKSLSTLQIPESVVRIGCDAFWDCNDELFDRHSIPGFISVDGWIVEEDWESDLNMGGNTVLKNCRGIADGGAGLSLYTCERLEFPDGLKSVGGRDFHFTSPLKHVVIPNSVEYIGENVFSKFAKELFDTNTISGVKMVDGWVVEAMDSSMVHVDLSKAKGIMPAAFDRCDDLESVVLPKNITRIEDSTFAWCWKLGSISIPKSVKYIGGGAFEGCESIKSIVIPEGVEYIGDGAFFNSDYRVMANIVIPSSVIYIGEEAFNGQFTYGDEKTATAKVPLRLKSMVEDNDVFNENILVTYYDDGNGGGGNVGNGDAVFEVSVVVANGCETMGKVTGGKTAKAGTKLTLKATPNKGYVFSHWDGPLDESQDPRSPSVTYIVGEGDAQFVAYFVPASDAGSESVIPSDASVYNGSLSQGDKVAGTIQAKVAKPKKGVAKVTVSIEVLGSKKVTVKGEMDVTTGIFTGTTKDGKTLSLSFGMDGVGGDFDGLDVVGYRDLFSSKDKVEKADAEDALALYLGAYAMICDGGTLSVTIAKKGKVTIKGTVDAAKVSAKAQALIGEDMICIPVVYSKKSVNLAFTIWLPINGGNAVIIGLDDAIIGKAGTLKNGAKFVIDGDIGAFIETEDSRTLELLPDNETITVSKSKWLVADGIKPAKVSYKKGEFTITEGKKGAGIVNPSGLKLSYKSKDGSFTGSFTAYAIVKGKLKKHKATIEGVLVNGIGYGTVTIKKIGTWGVTIE